ncbi:hypothetical protein M0R45_025547 [Rubus argutus]|uniref:Uncharacterized protein n=1 Tax=Rubus argutus TaxID=59490 RepID=A0AAW1WYI1_RUBAR
MGTQLSRVEVTGIQELCASSPLVGGSTALSVLSSPSCASGMPVVDRATCSCSFASEGRMQTNSSPLTSRSSEKLGSGCELCTTNTLIPQSSVLKENTNNACLSSGHTPKCSSVMGPVLTHHES